MEASNIPLVKWFTAIYLITAHKKGISSYQLAKDIGTSQKTSWFMLHRIREMMKLRVDSKLDNVVEIDEGKEGEAMQIWKDIFGKEFPTVNLDEAKNFSKSLSEGTLN